MLAERPSRRPTATRSANRTASATGAAPLTLDSRPTLSPRASFHELPGGAQWVVSVAGVPVSRVSESVVELLSVMDGETPLRALHARFGTGHDDAEFLGLVTRFHRAGLLDGSERAPARRIVFRPPLTVQFATLHAPALFARLEALTRPLQRRWLGYSVVALIVGGVTAFAAQLPEVVAAVTSPIPLPGLLIVITTLLLATLAHEAAHGLALVTRGGVPRRAGFMFLYLSPAFFVDVTDGWRLPTRGGRVVVALAGPAVHLVVAASCALAALAASGAGDTGIRRTLLVLAAASLVVVAVNLVPFVRFDGYIALMSALDIPNLQARTTVDAAAALTRLLYGGPRVPRRLDRPWSVPFGVCSRVAPMVLVGLALVRFAEVMSGGGTLAGLGVLALTALVTVVVVVSVVRAGIRIWRSGVSRTRFAAVTSGLIAVVAAAGAVVTVPVTVKVGFVADDRGVLLVASADSARRELPAGASVELTGNGVVRGPVLARGILDPRPATAMSAPVSALYPIDVAGVSLPVVTVGSVDVDHRATATAATPAQQPATGVAHVRVGQATAWEAAVAALVVRPIADLLGSRDEAIEAPPVSGSVSISEPDERGHDE